MPREPGNNGVIAGGEGLRTRHRGTWRLAAVVGSEGLGCLVEEPADGFGGFSLGALAALGF